jgi:hypothetical protein
MKDSAEDKNIQKIEEFFRVPERVANKIKNLAEKVKGGYVLFETRPRWDGSPGPWTKLPVAKIVFHKSTQIWNLYWMRASGKWEFYGRYKTLNRVLRTIEEDKHGCFWG